MGVLVLGLVLFLGAHSVRIVADDWRSAVIARRGEGAYKGAYTVASLVGLALLVWGYGLARQSPVVLWASPTWTRHLAALLMLPAMVFLTAPYLRGNAIKARLHHPMVLGVKTWALAHLVANNTLADLLLFGGFLVWAVLDFRSAKARDRAAGTVYPPGTLPPTLLTLGLGGVAWVVFAVWLHGPLIGVRPFG